MIVYGLSARAKLTLLLTALFAAGGTGMVVSTYALVEHNLSPSVIRSPATDPHFLATCAQLAPSAHSDLAHKCESTLSNGALSTARVQGDAVLGNLLWTSVVVLVAAIVLVALISWALAGAILLPVRAITEAARKAARGELSARLRLNGQNDELKRLGDTFDSMLDQLEKAFLSQQSFTANASHELRTPLAIMATTIDVAMAKPEISKKSLIRMATEVRGSIDEANSLVGALLELARSDSSLVRTEALDLSDIVSSAVGSMRSEDLAVHSYLDSVMVDGDRMLLFALVRNLLENAVKYNTTEGSIDAFSTAEPGTALLRVVNSGPAVGEADLRALFGRFARADARRGEDGHGLGLALVRSVAEAHGGSAEAVPGPCGGLEVVVRIPSTG